MTASSGAASRLWCWGGGELHLQRWGDEAVLFHEPTVSTHLLDADTGQVIAALSRAGGEISTSALWWQAFGSESQGDDCVLLCETLDVLARAGLVNPAPLP